MNMLAHDVVVLFRLDDGAVGATGWGLFWLTLLIFAINSGGKS